MTDLQCPCGAKCHARGLCNRCYKQARRAGNISEHPRAKSIPGDSLKDRLRHIGWDEDPVTGCWNWRGYTDSEGYGRLRVNGRAVIAARAAYEVWRYPPMPDEAVIPIVCGGRTCINPDHHAVTDRQLQIAEASATANWKRTRRLELLRAFDPPKLLAGFPARSPSTAGRR